MRSFLPFHMLTDEEWAELAVLPPEIERLVPDEGTRLLGYHGMRKASPRRPLVFTP